MFHNAAETFYQNVVVAYKKYIANRDSNEAGQKQHLRTAIDCAVSLYHFREHLPDDLKSQVNDLDKSFPEYELMRGVTNAAKHKTVTRRPFLVAKANDIKEVTTVILYSDDNGDYSHSTTTIYVECTDGETRWLDPAITRVFNYWGTFLRDAGECAFVPRIEPEMPGQRYLTRSEAKSTLNLHALGGLDFRQTMRVLRFDRELGRAVAVDLKGVEMRIYKPQDHFMDFTIAHPKYGDVTVTMACSDQESRKLHLIKNDSERAAFQDELMHAHWPEIENLLHEKIVNLSSGQSE